MNRAILLALCSFLLVGCSGGPAAVCQLESASWGCEVLAGEGTSTIVLTNNLGRDALDVRVSVSGECGLSRIVGGLPIGESARITTQCADMAEPTSMSLEYTVQSEFAGEPSRIIRGQLFVP